MLTSGGRQCICFVSNAISMLQSLCAFSELEHLVGWQNILTIERARLPFLESLQKLGTYIAWD